MFAVEDGDFWSEGTGKKDERRKREKKEE